MYTQAAEFTEDLQIATVTTTPLPAALPLFGAGLGLFGLLTRRRKRKCTHAMAD
jgi:hypothetical protein